MVKNNSNSSRILFFLLSFLILQLSAAGGFFIANATVRYVSHNGSNTPPYLTWETAADSIMSAINISVFGDTIYVANGVYEEQVIMIPGLSLIGAGMDSCVIDTRELVSFQGFIAVEVADSCFLKGFHIIVYNNSQWGYAIGASVGNSTSTIYQNKVTKGRYGYYVSNLDTSNHSEISVNKNIFNNVSQGIHLFNSNTVARANIIHLDPNSQAAVRAGISIEAFFFNYTPIIDSNYIEIINGTGIRKSFGARPTISNNIIKLNGPGAFGIRLSSSDSAWVFNNLIFALNAHEGINNNATQFLQLNNNYIVGNFNSKALIIGPDNVVKNNVIMGASLGVSAWGNENLVFKYNNVYNNDVNYSGFTPDSTNLSVDPMVVNDDSTQGELDFHLQMFSLLIDAGDPNIFDKDSTRSDIGLFGGPFGESYSYLDLAPRPPVNLIAEFDSNKITVRWNHNTEADFSHYGLFRDTTGNFTADSTTFVLSLTDTFYTHIIPEGVEAFYYKLTATDNQGNVSELSEELAVLITSVNEYPTIVSDYQLYQNYPNPFNPSTKIKFQIPELSFVTLKVFDVLGSEVATLVNEVKQAGIYEVEFDGSALTSGVYLYKLQEGIFIETKKMLLLK